MTIGELITSLAADVESNNFILQVVFDRHINEIEKLKLQGVTYKRIMELLNKEVKREFKKPNFNTLVFRAKQKIKSAQTMEVKTEISATMKSKPETSETTKPKPEASAAEVKTSGESDGLKQSLREWHLETNISIPKRLALRLESNGIDTEKLNELGLTTPSKINGYLTRIEHKKN